ncbi:DUF4118 domain-containing protein [Desulfosporosinus hippei]|uniref:histidine kinase n=1 Tax=Desulfosporosinus hippei DSM 8344 TaxID=1121419 RepID=A0A1G8JUS1_9FIRM|nr:DUF4118 domain-containing protein [Desulfosporosinus hippei]SDI34881.1 two-component system, OmpR family, sensor histidine kinase KdpD [Desulfosporosinus hippei DSM 8344]
MNKRQINNSMDILGKEEYSNPTKQDRVRSAIINVIVTLGIMTLATLLSVYFRYIGFHESNFIMAYILGVLIVAKQTDGYIYGILASVIGVSSFNFFFTEPYYTFATYRPDYPVTFLIMLIVASITSTLTAKAKQEARLSSLREKRTQVLYEISKGLLKVRSINQISEVGGMALAKIFNCSVIMATANSLNNLNEPFIYTYDNHDRAAIFKSFQERRAAAESFETGSPVGIGTEKYADSSAYYLPIRGQSGTLGVVGVSCFAGKLLTDEQVRLLEAVTTQIALAMERERLSEKQQKAKLDVERERLRSNLLRAISHDLRTPLTGILGSTATILDNDEVLDKKVKRELLQSVQEEASWLIHSVENMLNITRIDEGIALKKNMEAVEEIIAEAISRIKKFASNHIIEIDIPADLILLPMDGILIEQVLINLVDNALKYTPHGACIRIKTQIEGEKAIFEVSDNGNGIQEADIPFIFDRFYTAPTINMGRRGTGLGLAICKSIVTAHGGEISACNNPSGGATFRFTLPLKEGY